MPTSLPSVNDVHVDAALTDFAMAYGQDLAGKSVAFQASTVKKVSKQSDKYYIFDKGDFHRIEMDLRADGSVSKGAGFRLSTSSYYCDTYALHTYLTDKVRENADLDMEKAKVRYLVQQAFLKRDKIWAANAFTTSVYANTDQDGVSGTPSTNEFKQFDASGSAPLDVITEQMQVVYDATGYLPNTMVTGREVMRVLRNHSDFVGRYQYTAGGAVSDQQIADVLGIDKIVVGQAVENTAVEEATDSMSAVFGKAIALLYVAPAPSVDEPTAVTSFSWSPFDEMNAEGVAVDSWVDRDVKATKYEAEMSFDVAATGTDLGVYLATAVG